MNNAELQSFTGDLLGDANHDRYSLTQINTELENSQTKWNVGAKIITDTVTVTVVDGTRQYALSGLTGTPISFPRVTHKGIELKKRSKSWLDLYTGVDWTQNIGTPTLFVIEESDPDAQYFTLYPTPQSGDAGANLVLEYVKAHTPMSSSTDVPFMSGTSSNTLVRPYDWGLGYDAASRILSRDPSNENIAKSAQFGKTAQEVLDSLIQVFKQLEAEEPKRLRGGRYWNSGNPVRTV